MALEGKERFRCWRIWNILAGDRDSVFGSATGRLATNNQELTTNALGYGVARRSARFVLAGGWGGFVRARVAAGKWGRRSSAGRRAAAGGGRSAFGAAAAARPARGLLHARQRLSGGLNDLADRHESARRLCRRRQGNI